MQKITLIFPIYNKLEYTKRGLFNIYNCFDKKGSDELPIEIVITDDNSTDGSNEWIQLNYPKIHLIKSNGNLWWSGGINKAIEYSLEKINPDYFLLWNNDIRPEKNYFKKLFDILKNSPIDNIVCSKIYFENSNDIVQSLGGIFDPKNGDYYLKGYRNKDNSSLNNPQTVDWFPGMGTSIHKMIFETIGLFDDNNFPQYHGDSDFALRARKAGFEITAYPELKIWNDTSNTGFNNNASFFNFIKSLYSVKSTFNIIKDIKFYNRHSIRISAYKYLINKYFKHIGGYFKWKFLGIFGFRRKSIFI